MAVVTRRIQCSQCGAAHQVLDDALMVVCERCGAFVALRAELHWGGETMARRHDQAIRSMIAPSEAESRKLRASLAMAEAQAAGDHDTWRLWAREYYALLPTTDPELMSVSPDDPQGVSRWVRQSVEAAWLGTFDPEVRAAQGRFAQAAGALYRGGDPVAAARTALACAEAMYQAILGHPRYPAQLGATDPSHMAAEMLRSTLVGAAGLLGPGVVARIRRDVLGDEELEVSDDPATSSALRCAGCGASLALRHGDQRCPYCGAVVHVQARDPWLENLVGLWHSSRRQAEDDDAEALLVLTLSLSSHFGGHALPDPDSVWRFLAEGPSWLPARSLRRAIELMRHGYGEDEVVLAWLDGLLTGLDAWQPRGERPAAEPGPAPPEPDPSARADARDDPWVLQSLALWQHTRDAYPADAHALASAVLGFVMQPFYLGGTLRLAQALAFIEGVEPRPSALELAELAELMRQADAAPAASSLLQELAATLRGVARGS
ncbi:MAG: hypothetical protein H6712_30230 [Myxococcales bacterium]|nr:hypothetical protein [Myxococcales bacterium]